MTFLYVGDWLPTQPISLAELFGKRPVIGNLECVVSAAEASGSKAHSVILDETAYQHIQSAGFAALSLANNHVNDAGETAFREMLSKLDDIPATQFYGLAERPYASIKQAGERWAVIGCLERCRSRGKNLFPEEEVTSLIGQLRLEFDRIVVTPHWGKEAEYAYQPSPQQRKRAKQWIEAGADGVVGHHPHVIQGCEQIEGKPVFYSVGNFEFLYEEGAAYPATGYGLHVSWDSTTQEWQHEFLATGSGKVESIAPSTEAATTLERHFSRLSDDLACRAGLSERWTWARRVGPIYIPKSWKSWRNRFQKSFLLNFAKCCAWNIMPITWLLTLGWLFRDRPHLEASANTFELLKTDGKETND